MKKFYLGLNREGLQKSVYPLMGSITIGRSLENDVTLMDWQVSRSHARISFQQNTWVIEDLGSANGILFADELVTRKKLKSGDTFQIGLATLSFVEEDALESSELMSQTMEVFAAMIKYQSPLLEPSPTRATFMRLQGALLSTPIFRHLGKNELRGLEDIANLHLFSADQLIFREGDPGRSIYIILDGRVKVFTKDHDGKDFPLATLEQNQFFGEMSLLSGKPRSSSVATLEDSLFGEISYNKMSSLMRRHPKIQEVLQKYFHERMEDSNKKRADANIEERRREPRLSERLLIAFTVLPMENFPEEMINHTYKGTSSDISPSGALLESMGPAMDVFRPGCQLQLKIELPPGFGKIQAQGTVRHVSRDKNIVKLGIYFSNISASNKEKLQKFLFGQTEVIE